MKNYANRFPLPTGAIWARLPERVAALENPKLIKALISQTETNAPVPTILENNTGATLTFDYTVSGVYTITSDKPIFISGKMGVTLGLGANPLLFTYSISSSRQISIVSLSTGFSPANNLLSNNLLTIEIFN
jgi:hypothetical protein